MKKITLILVLILIASSLGCAFQGIAFAASETIYTDVLEDLGKDETFNAAQYPASDKDKMDVFQIAESNAGELFLYVYSTTGDKFTASEARISQSIGENLEPKDYKLTLLSRNGTLSKYIVNELTVKPDTVRYYVVVQIARPWDKNVDKEPPVNTAKTVPYPIGKQFTACTVDGNVSYSCIERQSIEVVAKYVGYIEYLLRLKFEANGEVYNLGVVDNKQAGSDEPSNPAEDAVAGLEAAMKRVTDFFNSVGDRFVRAGQWLAKNWWVIIVAVVVVVIVVSLFFQVGRQVLGAIFTAIGKALWWFVKYLGIGLFYVITSPYWIIRAIVLAAKRRKNE